MIWSLCLRNCSINSGVMTLGGASQMHSIAVRREFERPADVDQKASVQSSMRSKIGVRRYASANAPSP